jgi:hypothetical protein
MSVTLDGEAQKCTLLNRRPRRCMPAHVGLGTVGVRKKS